MTAIHYINHNFSDWDSQTKHMNRLERSIYLDLRTLYFSDAGVHNGRINASDFALLCYRLSCHSDEEINALKLILKDKFKKNGNTYRHSDWDKQIKAIQWEIKKGNASVTERNANSNASVTESNGLRNEQSNAQRQAIFRQKRLQMINNLIAKGIKVSSKINMLELEPLYLQHFAELPNVTLNNTQCNNSVTEKVTERNANSNAQKPSNKTITINHKPINIHTNAREQNFDVKQVLNLWNPPLQQINDALRVSGEQDISEQQFNHIKLEFLSHYKTKLENQTLRPEQLFGKFVSWIKRSKSHSVTHGVKTNETHQSNSVTEYRNKLQQQYDEYWANRAEQGIDRPNIIDVY